MRKNMEPDPIPGAVILLAIVAGVTLLALAGIGLVAFAIWRVLS